MSPFVNSMIFGDSRRLISLSVKTVKLVLNGITALIKQFTWNGITLSRFRIPRLTRWMFSKITRDTIASSIVKKICLPSSLMKWIRQMVKIMSLLLTGQQSQSSQWWTCKLPLRSTFGWQWTTSTMAITLRPGRLTQCFKDHLLLTLISGTGSLPWLKLRPRWFGSGLVTRSQFTQLTVFRLRAITNGPTWSTGLRDKSFMLAVLEKTSRPGS